MTAALASLRSSERLKARLAELERVRVELVSMGAGMAVLQVNSEIADLRRRLGVSK